MLVSYQPAFGVSVAFKVNSIGHEGWDETFETAAGFVTGFGCVRRDNGIGPLRRPSGASCCGLRGAEASASPGRDLNFMIVL